LGGLLTGCITPLWSSEVEPFAIRVTTKRLPEVKHYGDVSAINGADLPPVDIITFGSPCQDMSIAGKRDGLDGSRSSLFYEAIRIVKEMRCKTNGAKPRFIVWENVPGAFSSNKGQDFKAVLEAVIGVKKPSAEVPVPDKKGWPDADYYLGDGWSIAYRVLDAQWWGVPQRRKRIYLSQILQTTVPQKYYLSPKACLGILRRASVRGKELPLVLKAALERQAAAEESA
jgi:DNA (cytosine-5)-methyltransferase 1